MGTQAQNNRTTMTIDELLAVLTEAKAKLKTKGGAPVVAEFEDVVGWRLIGAEVLRRGDADEDLPPCVLLRVAE